MYTYISGSAVVMALPRRHSNSANIITLSAVIIFEPFGVETFYNIFFLL